MDNIFLHDADSLSRQLERCGICFARHCFITKREDNSLVSYNNTHVNHEPDELCLFMLDEFSEDTCAVTYTPLHDGYYSSVSDGAVKIEDFESAAYAVDSFKSYLFEKLGEIYFSPSDKLKFHAVFTDNIKVCVSGRDMVALTNSIFKLEEFVRMARRRDKHRDEIIRTANSAEEPAVKQHIQLESGVGGYVGQTKRYNKGKKK